jgi:hemoglobin
MMRARHLAFIITPLAREEWLACFERVLADAPRRYAFPQQHLAGFRAFLHAFSMWMVNTEDAQSPREPDRGLGEL